MPLTKFLRPRTGRARPARRGPALGVHALEDRAVPATFTVTTLADAGPGSLRQAVLDANARPGADTVQFAPGVRGTITLASQISITDDLTVRGPGAARLAVSGGDTTRVFAVLPAALADSPFVTPTRAQVDAAPEVTLTRLAVTDGLATNAPGFDPADPTNPGFAFGGGLFNLGGTVHLDRVHLADNQAAGVVTAGGAVANEFGGTLTVSRSTFEDNTSAGFVIGVGGAITSDLGPTADGPTRPPTVTIDRTEFTGNRAQAQAGHIGGGAFTGLGGGGAVINLTGAMTVSRSTFADNAAEGGTVAIPGVTSGGPGLGGAINSSNVSPFGAGQSTLDVSRSVFAGNAATGGAGGAAGLPGGEGAGGAVYVTNGGQATLTRNTFTANLAAGGNATGGNATGGAVGASGGAALGLELNLFAGNTASGGAGTGTGAAGVGRGGALGLHDFTLAGWAAGVLPTATAVRDLFVGNQAVGGLGGGIYNEGTLTLTRAKVVGNRAVAGHGGQGIGGGIYNLGTVDLDASLVVANFASTSHPDCFGC
jgi:hypothetical protein